MNNYEQYYSVLIKNKEDLKLFLKQFHLRNNHAIDDLLDFREYKIKKSNKSIEEFLKECYETDNDQSVFEQTFYQYFTIGDMELINMSLAEGRTSLESIFNAFKENINKNILKNIL